jgi:hypothetical protein
VAAYLNKSVSWTYKTARAEGLPTLRVGWELRFEPEKIKAYARGEWKPTRRGARLLPIRESKGEA